jgi:hypothetical protein
MADEYHKTVRGAVAARLVELLAAESLDIPVVEQDRLHVEVVDRPAVVCSASDNIAFPIQCSFLTLQGDLEVEDEDIPGGTVTKIREVARRGFNQKRIAALTDVYVCHFDPAGMIVDEQMLGQLTTQFTITPYARRSR